MKSLILRQKKLIRMFRSRKIICTGDEERVLKMRNTYTYRILVPKRDGKAYLGVLITDGKLILK
jgi:hypothetical protein